MNNLSICSCERTEMNRVFILITFITLQIAAQAQTDEIQNIDSLLETGLNISARARRMFSIDSAYRIAQLTFQLSSNIGYERGMAISQLNAIPYYIEKKKLDTAILLLNSLTSSQWQRDNNDNRFIAIAQWRIATGYSALTSYKRAQQYYERALESIEGTSHENLLPDFLQSYGSVFLFRGQYAKALDVFKQMLEKRRVVEGEDYSYHHEYYNITMVYARMKDFDTALKFARLAAREKGATGGSILMATIYTQKGQFDSALVMYRQAYDKAIQRNDSELAVNALSSMGGHFAQQRDFATANKMYRQALSVRNHNRPATLYLRIALNMEHIDQLDSALQYAKLGFNVAKHKKYNFELSGTSLAISRIYEKLNNVDSSLYYLKLHKVYSDSVYTGDLANQAANLRVQLETLEKEEEILILKKLNEVETAKKNFLYALILGVIAVSAVVLYFFRYRNRVKRKKLEMEKQYLVNELREKEKLLSNHTLQMIHQRNGFMEIEEELKSITRGEEVRRFQKIFNIIGVNKSLDREWDNFNHYFSGVHHGFYENLKQHSPLSLHEQRLCALIRMNLASREIATLLNIEVSSVKMAKYRLKKKLNLAEEEDLAEFLGRI